MNTAMSGLSPQRRPLLLAACLALAAVALLGRWWQWDYVSRDVAHFLYPWITYLGQHGFAGLATVEANYNPPYLYLLLIGKSLAPQASPEVITKLISTLFDVALAAAVVVAAGMGRGLARWLLFAAVLALPTVWTNSGMWGQCDAIYTFWMLVGILLVERQQTVGAGVAFSTALAFKLQPVFAGRSWSGALSVYFQQATSESDLSYGAPNLWTLAKYAFTQPQAQRIALLVGMALAVAFSLFWIAFSIRRLRHSQQHMMALVCTSALVLPFLLPKMHDRYFFPADILAVVMATRDRRWLHVAWLVQLGSLTAYLGYLTDLPGPLIRPAGILANCVAVALVARYWLQVARAEQAHPNLS